MVCIFRLRSLETYISTSSPADLLQIHWTYDVLFLLDNQFLYIVTSDLIVCLWQKIFLIIINTVSYKVSSESSFREKVKLWLKDGIKRRLNNSSNSNKQQNNHSSWNLWYINFGDISLLCPPSANNISIISSSYR